MKKHRLNILPDNISWEADEGENLLEALRLAGRAPEAPCGGLGSCGKCRVILNGQEVLACQTVIDGDMSVSIPETEKTRILADGIGVHAGISPVRSGYMLAYDIGTTTVVCYLLDSTSARELANASMLNPQSPYGADVLARIQHAREGKLAVLSRLIRQGMENLAKSVCDDAGISASQVGVVSVVGNPAMQQLFLGIAPDNLVTVPFSPVLTEARIVEASGYMPSLRNAALLIVPDIAGYIGADTVGCLLSTGLYRAREITLLVDIGTNGEMVLGNRDRMIACSTAAGPALEGAKIQFGMRGTSGAIDHVRIEGNDILCSVIGGGEASGICGSGLIDAAAALLEAGILNDRGRLQTGRTVPAFADRLSEIDGQRVCYLTGHVYLTQNDIQELQLAKGAIAAGITLMAQQLGISLDRIERVLLAGAFGNFLSPESACRIGLLPPALQGRIIAVGNAAGSGAKLLAQDQNELMKAQKITESAAFLELAACPAFKTHFAKSMRF